MEIDTTKPIRQIAVEVSGAATLFEKFGIDYYGEGNRELKVACSMVGVPLSHVETELKKRYTIPASWREREPDWSRENMASLIHYIIHVHHVKTRALLDDIGRELALLRDSHKERERLDVLRNLFQEIDDELRDHMLDEEKVIFPYLIYAERALEKGEVIGDVLQMNKGFSDSIREILFEHRFMDRGFQEMDKLMYLINDESAGDSLKALAKAVEALIQDNEKHIQLENNKLFRRSAQLGLME